MADNDNNDRTVPTTDLRELGAEDTTEDASFVERLRDRTESIRQGREKKRRKKRAKKRAGRIRKQRRRSALRESADNVVQAVSGRSIDDIGEFGGTNADEQVGGATTTMSTRRGQEPSLLDVDGDGDLEMLLPSSEASRADGLVREAEDSGAAPFRVDVTVEEATVEFRGERDSGGGAILPQPGSETNDDSDEDGFPPLI